MQEPLSQHCWTVGLNEYGTITTTTIIIIGDAAGGQGEEGEEQVQEALTDGSSATVVTGVRTDGIRECSGRPTRSQRVRRSGQPLPQPLHKTDNVARMKKTSSSSPPGAILAQVTADISSPPWLEPRWKSHPDQPASFVVLTNCDGGSMPVRQ